MNPTIKKLWIDALRSGDYAQGTTQLGTRKKDGSPNEYCCLGVLCELAIKNGLELEVKPVGSSAIAYDNRQDFPSKKVLDWAGLHSETGAFQREDGSMRSLAGRNDSGETFVQIAQYIEDKF